MQQFIYKHSILLLISFVIISNLGAQGFLKTQGKAIVNEQGDTVIIRAMGLGGWMLQEGYMLQTSSFANAQYEIRNKIEELIGSEDTDQFYDLWLANSIQKTDIDSLKSWGFNAVRLPMHYKLYTLPIEEEPINGEHTWLNKGFELTDSLLSWCEANEMYLLLDLHGAPGGQGYEGSISDYDPSKPSLWESKANRDKTVALWKKLAERYKDEPWIMGYDLINETNWNLPGNTLLRQLYKEITDSIRSVDNKHMILIEGNWFANDFSGLTPPWDDNMVYSPHKYWSKNETADIQWVLTIRDNYNIPLFFGESGENSNPWFRDAIRLFEEEGIGWAWWPLKKVESISCPLSVIKTPEYTQLLNYWNGNGQKPSAAFAKSTLFELAENMKIENCVYQKDVIDAMFRQVNSNTSKPYNIQDIPGIVYASDFSLGPLGIAYFDVDAYDYHVTTGNYTAWNSGWAYRNDAVDIEKIDDNINSNGYGIGWMAQGEWMKYDINVLEDGVYDIKVRLASNNSGGKFHLEHKGARISSLKTVQSTGGWYNWKNTTLNNVILTNDMKSFSFYTDIDGFNLSSFEFIKKKETEELITNYLFAHTNDNSSITLVLNKAITDSIPPSPSGFILKVNGISQSITSVEKDIINPRVFRISIEDNFISSDEITISYSGIQIIAIDGTALSSFFNKPVENRIEYYHQIPGKIEAEDYHTQLGIQLENCGDVGGGKNIAYLDPGDHLEYFIEVDKAGEYNVEYRTAAESNIGQVELYLIQDDGSSEFLHRATFNPTGGWQSWRSTNKTLILPEGKHKIRMDILKSQFNINWMDFTFLTSTEEVDKDHFINLYPNPTERTSTLYSESIPIDDYSISIYDQLGKRIRGFSLFEDANNRIVIDLGNNPDGVYYVKLYSDDGSQHIIKLVVKGER